MTGLIYVAIIAVWAIVLVPAWLRRHDHLDPERSVDRFSRSMRTLGSRPSVLGIPMPTEQAVDTDELVAEPEVFRVSRPELTKLSARVTDVAGRATGAVDGARSRVRSTSAAARRRIVLGVLATALAVTVGLVAAGVLLPVAIAAPAALLVGFLGLARHQVRQTRRRRTTAPRSAVAQRPATAAATTRTVAPTSGSTWEAQSTPLPTYVTAPPAAGFPRVIDTETPGAWTAAAMLERAQQEKMRAERMARAKAEAIARAKAEQAAAEARNRDEEFLTGQAAQWQTRRRAANE